MRSPAGALVVITIVIVVVIVVIARFHAEPDSVGGGATTGGDTHPDLAADHVPGREPAV